MPPQFRVDEAAKGWFSAAEFSMNFGHGALATLRIVLLFASGCHLEQSDSPPQTPGAQLRKPVPVDSLPSAAVFDLGVEQQGRAPPVGFFAPEVIGARRASWSDGPLSKLKLSIRPDAERYLIAFLVEPYHAISPVSLAVAVNGADVGSIRLERGWQAHELELVRRWLEPGTNEFSFRYSRTARPIDAEPASTDARDLSVLFDQVQLSPVTREARLVFSNRDALGLALMDEGWAKDPNDKAPGVWTSAQRAALKLYLAPAPGAYELEITAHALPHVKDQKALVRWNSVSLGQVTFSDVKGTAKLTLAADQMRDENELVFELEGLRPMHELNPESDEKRLLGIRLVALAVVPSG
jgi:hypothetical protein